MCMPNSPLFQRCQVNKILLLKKALFSPILEWCKISDNHVYAHNFRLDACQAFVFTFTQNRFLMMRVIFKLLSDQRCYERVL